MRLISVYKQVLSNKINDLRRYFRNFGLIAGARWEAATYGEVSWLSDGTGGIIGVPTKVPYQPSGSVVLQGDAPVCGPACAAMVITDTTGSSVSLESAIESFANGIRPTGVNTAELSSAISNAGIPNTMETAMLPGQLNQALQNGQTVIVNINGHFFIVDSEVTVNGVSYYMTRDPYTGPRGVLATELNSAIRLLKYYPRQGKPTPCKAEGIAISHNLQFLSRFSSFSFALTSVSAFFCTFTPFADAFVPRYAYAPGCRRPCPTQTSGPLS